MGNVAAEFGLLAGLCHNPELYFELQQHLSIDDFTSRPHRDFFIVMQRLLMNSTQQLIVTQPGLLAEAGSLGMKDFYTVCNDGELIEACLAHTASKDDTLRSFAQVKRESVKRQYGDMFKQNIKYLGETADTTNDIITKMDSGLISLGNKLQGVVSDEIINLAQRSEEVIMDLASRPGELGVDIGFPIWQRSIGGLRNGSVTFMAATAKAGKSQIGVRAAVELSKYIPVLYCDSELNEVAQSVRAFGMYSEINYEILETGYWKCDLPKILADGYDKTFALQCKMAKPIIEDKQTWDTFKKRELFYKKMTGMTAREMIPFLRRWIMQHVGMDKESRTPRCLIVWDYIKLARIDEVKSMGVGAHDILGDACMALHDFAEEYNLPILAFGQTNRQLDMDLNMIAGAKKIVELVDSISIWKRKDPDDLVVDPSGTHEIHQLASRYGKGVSTYINVQADLGIGKFKELGVANPKATTQQQQNAGPAKTTQNKPTNQSQDDDNT